MVERVVARAVERSAAPAAVALTIEALAESHAGLRDRLDDDRGLVDTLVAVAGASRFLARMLVSDEGALGVLADLDVRPAPEVASVEELAGWKRRELLRIAARDLLG
ncbi:MAG: hypothetical protein ACRD0S_03165, partial [Acidimicrobiales bacterium]